MPTKKESSRSATLSNLQDLVEKIEKLTVLELSQLTKLLEEKFGISVKDFATPMVSTSFQGASDQPAPQKEEKTLFNVVLKEPGASKIQVIKAIKEITGKGLTEARDLVEKVPATVKEGVKMQEGQEIKKKLEEAGAVVALE